MKMDIEEYSGKENDKADCKHVPEEPCTVLETVKAMAIAEDIEYPTQLSSEEAFDNLCSPCAKHGKTAEATHYCPECDECYCHTCHELHGRFSGLTSHVVLESPDKHKWGQKKKSTSLLPKEKCDKHGGMVVSMFCGYHDVFCCHICSSLEHRSCESLEYIPIIAKGILSSQKLQQVKTDIQTVTADLEKIKNGREWTREEIKLSKHRFQTYIKEFRTRLNERFDALEAKATSDMCDRYGKIEEEIQEDIKTCDDHQNTTNQLKDELNDDNNANNEAQMFVILKHGISKVRAGKKIVFSLSKEKQIPKFVIDPKIEPLFTDITTLELLASDSIQPVEKLKTGVFVSKSKRVIDVRTKDDTSTCFAHSCCQMPNGTLIVVDSSNNKIKRLDAEFKLTDQCDTILKPRVVCRTGPKEVAVSTRGDTVQFVTIETKRRSFSKSMVLTKSLKFDHDCYGLAYNNDTKVLYIAEKNNLKNCIYVHDKEGRLLRTLSTDKPGFDRFPSIKNIALSDDGTKVYITDYDKGLLTLDAKGELVATFGDPQLCGACGVCTDGDGNVFVCGYASHNVLQLEEKGQHNLGALLTKTDGLLFPVSMYYDRSKSALVVTHGGIGGCDTLSVFKLEKSVL